MTADVLFVATIETRYDVIAVAATEDEAVRLAARKGYEYVTDNGRHPEDYDYWDFEGGSDDAVLQWATDFMGATVTEIQVGTAAFGGDRLHV